MRGTLRHAGGFAILAFVSLSLSFVIPIPAAAVTATVPYSATPVSDADLDGNPATGDWSGADSFVVPLENAAASPYGAATVYAKHDGTYAYFRLDGAIDVPWQSAGGNHFWVGMFIGPASVTGHHQTGQDGIFFGDSRYTSGAPLIPVDTDGNRPPTKDASQDDLGEMLVTGSAAPYSFTTEWKRKLNTGDANDVIFVADGTSSFYFYVTTDSDGNGSGGGNIGHKGMTNDNVLRFAAVPPPDSTRPDVSITAPANGATVSGTVLLAATASDNVGVVSVTFFVDGNSIGTDSTAPYEQSWDTTSVPNGPHRIRADARDAAGNIGSHQVDVTVDNADRIAPTAVAGSDVSVPPGTAVTLDASASNDNVGIVDYTWTFNDGGSQLLPGVTVTYSFNNLGNFLVTLTVTDGAGNVGTDTLWVNVTSDRSPPIAYAGIDQDVLQGTLVTLDGRGSTDDVAVANYTWTFSDRSPVTLWGSVVTYRFLNRGNFQVTLTVADYVGNRDTDPTWVNVTADPIPPVANAGPDMTILFGDAVVLDASNSTDNVYVANYTWRIEGAGALLYGPTVSYRPAAGGLWRFTLVVADASGLQDSDEVNVTVVAPDVEAPKEPTGLAVAPSGPGSIILTWTANSEPDLAGYVIFRSGSPDGPFIQLNTDPITRTTHVDLGLVSGRSYTYIVRAIDASGNLSGPSIAAQGTAGLFPPEPFDWADVRWALAPIAAASTFVILALLSWREERRRGKVPPKEGA